MDVHMYVPAYYLDIFSRYVGSSPPLESQTVSSLRSVKSFMRSTYVITEMHTHTHVHMQDHTDLLPLESDVCTS